MIKARLMSIRSPVDYGIKNGRFYFKPIVGGIEDITMRDYGKLCEIALLVDIFNISERQWQELKTI